MAKENITYRELSHEEEKANNNILFETWTGTWGVKVYPWYSMDRLKFSFVEKGAKGAGKSFDICMDARRDNPNNPCFEDWAYDILHDRRFEAIMKSEANAGEKYPKHYKYITGTEAEKSIGFCNSSGKGGYCLNASIPGSDGKKIFANIPLNYHCIRHLAESFVRSYESRKVELEEIRRKAELQMEENRVKYSKSSRKTNDAASKEQKASSVEMGNSSVASSHNANEVEETKQEKKVMKDIFMVKTKGQVNKKGDLFFLPVESVSEKKLYTLFFSEKNLPKEDVWENFVKKAPKGAMANIEVFLQDDKMQFIRFASAS